MLKMTAGQNKMIGWFAFAIFLAALYTGSDSSYHFLAYDIHTYLYAGLVIGWGFLVHQRIVNRQVRQHLVLAAVFMLLLFLSRLVRWRCFCETAIVQEYAWYTYYISFNGVPLCAFLAALCVGKEEKERPLRYAKWLWLVQSGFMIVVFTNDLHELFFKFQDSTHLNYSYGVAYYTCVAWTVVLSVAAMVTIVKRCQITAVRRRWMIPMAGMLFFAGLILGYYIEGGSPTFFGIKFIQLQEAFCFLFVFPFESMIQIGIMPSNTRYALFFENLPISAEISDEGGETIYASKNRLCKDAQEDLLRRSEKKIHGGKIVWYEDLTAIRKLDEEIQNVTEELEEENELIRQENEVRSERIRYETQNRLYDKIAGAVREKALAIDAILAGLAEKNAQGEGTTDEARNALIRAMVLGAYVKRMGNMMLITEEAKEVSTQELGSAVRESLEYFGLTGAAYDFREKGERLLPAKMILLAYELLEVILENEAETYSLMVLSDAREGFLFRIMIDAVTVPVDAGWRQGELAASGAFLAVECFDETWRITLRKAADERIGKEGEV